MSTIGQRVKELRQLLVPRVTPAELARRIGIKQPSLHEIENNITKSLKAGTLMRLCEELHTTADYLLRGVGGNDGLHLAAMEAELLYTVRSLSPDRRLALLEYARFLLSQQGGALLPPEPTGKVEPIHRPGQPKKPAPAAD